MTPEFWESLRSPCDLFAAAGVESPSRAVDCILDALHGCPPTAEQRDLWRDLSPQPWPERKLRRGALAIGRRGLKTSGVLARDCVFEALRPDHDAHALPGSRVYCVVVAPKLAQSREAIRAIRAALDSLVPIGVRYELRDAAGSPEIVLSAAHLGTERVITVQAADSVGVRGYAIAYAGVDEAAFLGSDDWLAETDRDLLVALSAGQVQFAEARMLLVSSCGAPQGQFFKAVTSPGADTLVVKAPTWRTNPRISRDDCLRIAGGDADMLAQEFESSRWGFSGECFIDAQAIRACIDERRAGLGARRGHFVVGLDIGQRQDASAIVACSSFGAQPRPGEQIAHVAVDHLEVIEPDKKSPPSLERIVGRALAVARQFGHAPIVTDPYCGPTVEELLIEGGYKRADSREKLRARRYFIAPMGPTAQTPRWALVRQLVMSRRAHFHPLHERLMRELAGLRATSLSAGGLRIEGKRDDVADAFALATEIAVTLPSSGTDAVQFRVDGFHWSHEQGLTPRNPRWVQTLSNGREVPAEMPESARGFRDHAVALARQGYSSPVIERYFEAHPEDDPRVSRDVGVSATPIEVRNWWQKQRN